MAGKRKPKVEMYWSTEIKSKEELIAERAEAKKKGIIWSGAESKTRDVINWRLVGANCEVMCQSTQGYTSRQDAHRSIDRCAELLTGTGFLNTHLKRVGPGRKPQ